MRKNDIKKSLNYDAYKNEGIKIADSKNKGIEIKNVKFSKEEVKEEMEEGMKENEVEENE